MIGAVLGEANWIYGLGEIERELSLHPNAREFFGRALALCRQIGSLNGEAFCTLGLGQIARTLGEPTAREQLDRALQMFTRIEQLEGRGKALLDLAQLTTDAGGDGRPILLDALDSHTRFGNPRWIGETHRRLARIGAEEERAVRVRQAREAWAEIDRPDLVAELVAEFSARR